MLKEFLLKFRRVFNKNKIIFFPFFIIFVIIVFSGGKFIFSNEPVLFGEFVNSTNFSQLYQDNSNVFNPSINLGRYNLGIPVSNGDEDIFGTARGVRTAYWLGVLAILQNIFKGFADKIYILFAIFFPFMSMFILTKKLFHKLPNRNNSAFVASLIYGINPWIIGRITGGFLQLNIAYGIFPLLFLFAINRMFFTTTIKNIFRDSIIFGFFLAIILLLSPHFIILFGISFFFIFLCNPPFINKKNFKQFFIFTILSIGITFLLTDYYFIPSFLYQEKSFLYQFKPDYFSIPALIFNGQGATLLNILRLNPLSYLSLTQSLKVTDYFQYIYLSPILILPFLKKKMAYLPFIVIYFIGLFFAKGVNPPFQAVSYFLYDNIPIFYPFRDPTKFLAIMCFSLAILWGYLFTYSNKLLNFTLLPLFLLWILFTNPIFISGDFKNSIKPFNIPKSYFQLNKWLSQQSGNFRVLYLPNYQNMTDYLWYPAENSPSVNFTPYHALIPLSKPLADPSNFYDSYSSEYVAFLENNLNNTKLTSLLLNKINTKYIILDNNFRVKSASKSQALIYLKDIKEDKILKEIKTFSNLSIYENITYKNVDFLRNYQSIIPVVGGLEAYNLLENRSINVANSPVVFLQEGDNYKLLPLLKKQPIFFVNTSILDLVGEELKNDYLLNIAKDVWNNEKGWGIIEAYLQPYKSLYGLIFTSGQAIGISAPGKVDIKFDIPLNSKYILLSKNFKNPQGGRLKYLINGKLIKNINNKALSYNLNWVDIGNINLNRGKNILEVESNKGTLFIIDGIEIIPENTFKITKEKINNLIGKNKIYISQSNRNYKKNIFKNIPSVEFLYSYSPNWSLGGKKPFISDYYANIFFTNKNNNLKFLPDNLYTFLFNIDLFFWIIAFIIIIWRIIF